VPGAPCGWIGCSWNQCPTAPAPISTGKDPPRLNQQKRKSQSERPAPSALAFLLPAARPDQHRKGLPPTQSAQGRTAPPTVTTCPICPAWAVTACPMSSGPPARSPARAAPSSRTPPPPCCPHPCQTYRQRQPPARQHPAASPTPEGSDSPPNGIWL
jgi:hypothetical protein